MSAKKNLNGNGDTLNQSCYNKSGSGFFAAGSNPTQTFKASNANMPMGSDIQSLIDGFHQETSSFKDGIRIRVK